MALYIDHPVWPGHNRLWAHLISDTSYAELHAAARALGIPERGFDGDHYDVPTERWNAAVEYGATPVSSREIVQKLRAAGLRVSKYAPLG